MIEQAIFDLHEVKLRIEVRVTDNMAPAQEPASQETPEAEDPLITAGRALGGVVDETE